MFCSPACVYTSWHNIANMLLTMMTRVTRGGIGQTLSDWWRGIYREYKGGVSGLDTGESQLERMQRTKELWENTMLNKDYIIAGDLNIDWNKINDPNYQNSSVAKKLMDFILEENMQQLNENIDPLV